MTLNANSNRIIADLFAKIHFGEKMGTGFERIREICEKENAPLLYLNVTMNVTLVNVSQM